MTRQNPSAAPFRIAVVWGNTGLMAQHILSGLYRWANLMEDVTVRRFDGMADSFDQSVLQPVLRWKPHGVIARVSDVPKMLRLRKRLRGVPFVATCDMPPTVADTVVAGDTREAVRISRNHFQEQGVRTMAYFCAGHAHAVACNTAILRSEVPNAPVLAHDIVDTLLREEPTPSSRKLVGKWLQSLPKPAGVLTLESTRACFWLVSAGKLACACPKTSRSSAWTMRMTVWNVNRI